MLRIKSCTIVTPVAINRWTNTDDGHIMEFLNVALSTPRSSDGTGEHPNVNGIPFLVQTMKMLLNGYTKHLANRANTNSKCEWYELLNGSIAHDMVPLTKLLLQSHADAGVEFDASVLREQPHSVEMAELVAGFAASKRQWLTKELVRAVECGPVGVVEALLAAGADPNARDSSRWRSVVVEVVRVQPT